VASEKQIAANRRNAQRSTGPRTAAGKSISSRNALRHGLSLPPDDADAKAMIDRMALAFLDKQPNSSDVEVAKAWASAHWDLWRIKKMRRDLLAELDSGQASLEQLQLLLATYRYDHRARTKRRRAAAKLKE
jgi:hypothetical protein